jgi:non-heme chloroperoxidase
VAEDAASMPPAPSNEGENSMAITKREAEQVKRANAARKTPVVFIHGLWLLPSSWDRWARVFRGAGYAPLTPGWPDDPSRVEAAREDPDAFAGKSLGDVAEHIAEVIDGLDRKPAVVGHSFGGVLAQIMAGRGLSAATVAIDPAPFRGVYWLPPSTLRSALPILSNPLNRGKAKALSFGQFRYGWANAVDEQEAKELYDTFHVPGSATFLFQGAMANLNPWTELKVDTKSPERGPMLLISGRKDHTVPWAIVNAEYKKQRGNDAVTEVARIPDRGHSLTIDSGWREVADTALDFVKRFT